MNFPLGTGLSKGYVALIAIFVVLTVCAVIIILVFLVRKQSRKKGKTIYMKFTSEGKLCINSEI